jgi:hypothetical protein
MEGTMKRLLGSLALALLTCGCAYQQSGHPFDSETVAQLQPGVSTDREAVDKLGPASGVFNYAGGSKLLTWGYVHRVPIGTNSEARAAILFDADGKMIRVAHFWQQRAELWWNP